MSNDNILLAIPARGGSKRLPGKNIKLLAGKPMIAYTIEAALNAGLGENVYVCSDDMKIIEISEQYGAKIFQIPSEMATDEISSTTPCLSLYNHLLSRGIYIEYIFNLQPTSPLRIASDIGKSFETLRKFDADYLVSTTFIDPHFFHWAVEEKKHGWEMYFGKKYLKERTQLPPVYRPNGAIKLAKAKALNETGSFFGMPLQTYLMPEERSIHVATFVDFILCESLINFK